MSTFRLTACFATLAAVVAAAAPAFAQDPPPQPVAATPAPPAAPPPPAVVSKALGGGTMSSDKTIAQNIAGARDLADFTAAMRASDQEATLASSGPFTVFAATRGGFDRLPKGDLDRWMRSDKRKLTSVVTYNIVPEALNDEILSARIKAGHGEAYLATVQGGNLTVKGGGHNFYVTDVNGTHAHVIGGAPQSNGMVYVVDNVLEP